MLRVLFLSFAMIAAAGSAQAQEYCVDKYDAAITQVNAELGGLVKRQSAIDKRLAEILIRAGDIASEIAAAASKVPPDTAKIQQLSGELSNLKREKTDLEAEGFRNQDRVVALKGVIPVDLQGKLRGCVEATQGANKLVNLTIQILAILSTGGASLSLPPKSLYVDMSAVLNGYPTGGPHSVINEARESALNAIGAGGENNDLGRAVRDPGRVIRCAFLGC